MYMLQSRAEPNISKQELESLDEKIDASGSLNAGFKGFFNDSSAKDLFRIVLDHLAYCVRHGAASKKDAEYVLVKAVINWSTPNSPSAFEMSHIERYLADMLRRHKTLSRD